jgi:homoserine kinase
MDWSAGAVRVLVPATSANLGPGFDALGLALTLHDEVEARILPSGLSIEISGAGEDLAGAGEEHLIVRAMRVAFAVTGGQPPGLGLRCVNRIPHGRGLGSSAAAVVAGLLAAQAQSDSGKLADAALLPLACELEGHPDNVAACLGGGLTIAWTEPDGPHMIRLEPLASLTPVVCVAPAPVRTDVARGLLPGLIPHRDAAANAGRSALLIAALTQPGAGQDVLLAATQDLLHQEYRASAMSSTHALVRGLRAAGLPAVVSGAGPSVLAFLRARGGSGYRHDLDSLGSIVRETGIAWHISSLDVERQGARVLRPESSPGC